MRPAVLLFAAALLVGIGAAVARPAAGQAVSTAGDYLFSANTGLLVFHVHRERTRDFEQVMGRIATGLQNTTGELRRAQAAGWRLFRARDSSESAVYVVLVDPVVRDSDYDPVKMLTELAPGEAADLYDRLRMAVIRAERLDLDRLD
jgi:hypothetical protein